MKPIRLASYALIVCVLTSLLGCAGGSTTSRGYYGYRYGPDPWYYRGGYVRDRVHVVSEDDIRTLEAMDSYDLPPSADPGFDMGFGDMDFGGGEFDF